MKKNNVQNMTGLKQVGFQIKEYVRASNGTEPEDRKE